MRLSRLCEGEVIVDLFRVLGKIQTGRLSLSDCSDISELFHWPTYRPVRERRRVQTLTYIFLILKLEGQRPENIPAQGNALGNVQEDIKPCKGVTMARNVRTVLSRPFRAEGIDHSYLGRCPRLVCHASLRLNFGVGIKVGKSQDISPKTDTCGNPIYSSLRAMLSNAKFPV